MEALVKQVTWASLVQKVMLVKEASLVAVDSQAVLASLVHRVIRVPWV